MDTILAESSPDHEDRDLISATLTNSTHLTASNNEAPADNPSRGASMSPPTQFKRKCTSCLENIDDLTLGGRCGHDYCFDCMKSLFIGATRDDSLYPPRCCGQPIPREISHQVLNREELSEFDQRVVEYTAQNQLYCANPTCSHIIPKVHIKNDLGTCPSCHKKTHLPCLSLEHPGTDCPEDEALKQVLALSKAKNWQRCSRCQTMVELGIGCAHIICRCGHQFCYVCGLAWKTCACGMWDLERRLAPAFRRGMDFDIEIHLQSLPRFPRDDTVPNPRNLFGFGGHHHGN